MDKRLVTTLAVLAAIAGASAVLTSQDNPTKDELMKAKAGYAHKLLDAVVLGNFEAVQDQAFRLKAVSETAEWSATKSPWYVRESDGFIRATEQLYEAAKQKDADATSLAFVDLTLRCVKCHQGLRSEP